MQSTQPSLIARPDTLLGACEGLGEDLGFNPQYVRVALAGMLFWNPAAALGTYAVLALIVHGARWLCPIPGSEVAPHDADADMAAQAPVERALLIGENDQEPARLAVAA